MSLINANNVSRSFGDFDVFSDISLSVPPKARIGFVGVNGSGKTTLLKILIGLDEPDTGTVSRAKDLTIGYLPQQIEIASEKTPYESCMESFADVLHLQKRLNDIEEELTTDPTNEELIRTYGKLQQQFEQKEGYTFGMQITRVLQGLGLTNGEEHRPWSQLSGGQKIRAYLAKIILSDPDILILDEPTNHLDITSIEWLESYLKEYTGAVLMVSHDRYFLDQCVQTIWELSESFEVYRGNYSAYLLQREERYNRRLAEYERQQEFIEKEEEYIRRNIAGQNTRQAQGRRKRLESLLRDSRITKPNSEKQMYLQMKTDLRSGDLVLRTQGVKIGYWDDRKVLFEVPDLTLQRGECAAIIGPNGTGKSTFLKTILGKLEPLEGKSELGSNLKLGYFAQAHEDLDPEKDLMDEIGAVAPNLLPNQVRDYLAKYMFTGDDVYKKVRVLSGGERGRLALALLSLQGANLLLLDEPMNHLDIASQELLQSVLKNFDGTIILVSHDRYLIDGIATQVWEVLPQQQRLVVFNGTYSQYKQEMQGDAAINPIVQKTVKEEPQAAVSKPEPVKKLSNNEIRRINIRKEAIEKQMSELEAEQTLLGQKMNDGTIPFETLNSYSMKYNKNQELLDTLFEEWSELEEKLM